jgi:hypothetical protein
MAAAFFDLTPQAFRMKELRGDFQVPERTSKSKHRRYSLKDLRQIAYSLRENSKIGDRQLKLIILRLDAFEEPLKKRRGRPIEW